MCGIFGLTYRGGAHPSQPAQSQLVKKLLLLSETRGKEATGLDMLSENRSDDVHKGDLSGSLMLKSLKYQQFFQAATGRLHPAESLAAGHDRLVTNGMQALILNNQSTAAATWRAVPGAS